MNLDELAGRAVVTVEELAPLIGMSPRSVHRAMDRGEVPEWRCGRRRLVPVPALLRCWGADPPTAAGPEPEPGAAQAGHHNQADTSSAYTSDARRR